MSNLLNKSKLHIVKLHVIQKYMDIANANSNNILSEEWETFKFEIREICVKKIK